MERLSRLSATDAVQMRQRAAEKKTFAADRAAHGDQIDARYANAEADALERDALDVLDPLTHTTAPIQIGRGGELATGAAMMQPYVDTVRAHRIGLSMTPPALAWNWRADRRPTMALDAAETIQASNNVERMLVHELAAAHSLCMRMMAAAGENLAAYKNTGHQYPHRRIEAARMANTAARLMDAYQRGLLTLDRMRNGGRQVVTVQHVNVSAGGQAVVAGSVGTRNRGDGQE
jgi:hypothetical protein